MSENMNQDRRTASRAGGSLMAGSILAGSLIGVIAGEPSIGFVAGAVFGMLMLGLLWWKDRR